MGFLALARLRVLAELFMTRTRTALLIGLVVRLLTVLSISNGDRYWRLTCGQ
jgi:hypothetical protein